MYTNKDKIQSILLVDSWRVEGWMHVLAESRLTDALNSKSRDFLAVTDVSVYDAVSGNLIFETPFLAVNRMSISVVYTP